MSAPPMSRTRTMRPRAPCFKRASRASYDSAAEWPVVERWCHLERSDECRIAAVGTSAHRLEALQRTAIDLHDSLDGRLHRAGADRESGGRRAHVSAAAHGCPRVGTRVVAR